MSQDQEHAREALDAALDAELAEVERRYEAARRKRDSWDDRLKVWERRRRELRRALGREEVCAA